MPTLDDILHEALSFHQQGNYAQAQRLYREAISTNPNHADAHHLLGLATLGQGHTSEAIELIRRAIELDGNPAMYHFNLGAALSRAGDHSSAVSCYRAALERSPEVAAIHDALGSALRATGDSLAAEAEYREALRLDPALVAAHNNLGNALQDQGRLAEAATAFAEAVRLQPALAEVHFNLGNCLKEQGRTEEAIAAYQQAVRLRGDLALAWQNLGLALQQLGRYSEAADHHRHALAIQPTLVEAHVALGVALQMLGKAADAVPCYRRALAQNPESVTAEFNLASALHMVRSLDEAALHYRRVVTRDLTHAQAWSGLAMLSALRGDLDEADRSVAEALRYDPDSASARTVRGTVMLARGRMPEGWRDFESRLQADYLLRRSFDAPRWDGSLYGGRTLLIHAQWGLGDTLQFIRYLPMVRARSGGGRLVVEVPRQLIPLLESSGIADLAPAGDPLPKFDLQVSMLSLPDVFQTTLETIPHDVPYLFAQPTRISQWQERLSDLGGIRVGIHWQGNADFQGDRYRSMSVSQFAPLAAVNGVRLVSLQKGYDARQHERTKPRFDLRILPGLDEEGGAFLDTAAVIKNLDLVVTNDSAVAHLAGAMGAPVWLALSLAADWRWLRDRDDSPWYPTMRLFRQSRLEVWEDVFARIAQALASLVPTTRPRGG